MGVEKIIDMRLDKKEKENFAISVSAVKELFKAAVKIDPELAKQFLILIFYDLKV